MSSLKQFRNEDGKLIEWAWPGGYPIIYISRHGDILCPACSNKDLDYMDQAVAGEVYYEGPVFECTECNTRLESAYGDPDDDGGLPTDEV